MSTDDMGEALHREGAARDLTCSAVHPPLFSSRGDHPHTDPMDGRTECDMCGKWVFPILHSCKGIPVTAAARARHPDLYVKSFQSDSDHNPMNEARAAFVRGADTLAQYDAQARAKIDRAAHARAARRRKADERMAADLRSRGWVVQAPPAGQ